MSGRCSPAYAEIRGAHIAQVEMKNEAHFLIPSPSRMISRLTMREDMPNSMSVSRAPGIAISHHAPVYRHLRTSANDCLLMVAAINPFRESFNCI